MFAFLAAIVFGIELLFDPDVTWSLLMLGLVLLSLHFVFPLDLRGRAVDRR